jgi:hypothetical protein
MDEDINEQMRTEGLSRRQAEEKYFGGAPLSFEVLVILSRAAIRIAEETRMPPDLINTWQRVHSSATTESQASKVKLHGIISAVKTGAGMDEEAFHTRLSEIALQLIN